MSVALHVVITGKVQGVWYRKSAFDKASALGLAGWVRNLSTGEVEGFFEGEAKAVEKMVEWCRVGPPFSKVLNVEVRRGEPAGIATPFEIRPTL